MFVYVIWKSTQFDTYELISWAPLLNGQLINVKLFNDEALKKNKHDKYVKQLADITDGEGLKLTYGTNDSGLKGGGLPQTPKHTPEAYPRNIPRSAPRKQSQ